LLERAAEIVNMTGARWCEAEIARLQARYSASDAEEAIELLRASLATARAQGAKLWELRAATDLARLLHDRGDRDAARDMLAPVYRWFDEGTDTPDLVAARALLDKIGRG